MEGILSPKERQEFLLEWLNANHIPGRFWSIEEICSSLYCDDAPIYTLNIDPYIHDKCIMLSNDVRAINWSLAEGCMVIIKDTKGGIKLCESEDEFNSWRQEQLAPLEKKWKYLNTLVFKKRMDGSMDITTDTINETLKR